MKICSLMYRQFIYFRSVRNISSLYISVLYVIFVQHYLTKPITKFYIYENNLSQMPVYCTLNGERYGVEMNVNDALVSKHMIRLEGVWRCVYPECRAPANRYKTNIRSHVFSHLGLKPYKCLFCPTSASQRTNLRTHFLTKHWEKGVNSPQASEI